MNTSANNMNNNFKGDTMNMGYVQNENNTGNFDIMQVNFNNMKPEERKLLREKSLNADLADVYSKIKDINDKYDEKFENYNNKLTETKEQADKTAELINVIGFGIHSKKGKNLRSACASRVHSILGDMSGFNYLLWNSYFFKKIYNDLGNCFEVDSYKNIHINDYEKAKTFAHSWRPDDTYVYEKTQELIEKRNKGMLNQTRCMALAAYLEATDNGTYNPF